MRPRAGVRVETVSAPPLPQRLTIRSLHEPGTRALNAAEEVSEFPRLVLGDLEPQLPPPAERAVLTRFFYNRGYGEVDETASAGLPVNTPTDTGVDPQNKLDYIFYSKAQSSPNGGSVKPLDGDSGDPDFPCEQSPCTSDHLPLVGSTTVTRSMQVLDESQVPGRDLGVAVNSTAVARAAAR